MGAHFLLVGKRRRRRRRQGDCSRLSCMEKNGNSKVISGVLFVAVVAAVIASPDCYLTKIPSRIVPSVSEMSCE